jgi:hypothetical protein
MLHVLKGSRRQAIRRDRAAQHPGRARQPVKDAGRRAQLPRYDEGPVPLGQEAQARQARPDRGFRHRGAQEERRAKASRHGPARTLSLPPPLAAGHPPYVWLDVLLYTGPRRGDAAIIGRQHEKDIRNEDGSVSRVVQFKTEKSGELVTVTIPILAPLRRTLDMGPPGI